MTTPRILVATDFSPHGERAVARAKAISKATNAPLTVLHVVDADAPKKYAEELREIAECRFAKRRTALRSDAGDRTTWSIAVGRDYKAILEYAEAGNCGLIVLGLHREELVRDLLVGSTVQRVIKGASVPVLVVRDLGARKYARIVVGIDFSKECAVALREAIDWFPNAQFNLVHAYDVPFEGFLAGNAVSAEVSARNRGQTREFMKTFLDEMPTSGGVAPKLKCGLRLGVDVDVLRKETSKIRAQLLVIGRHGRSGPVGRLLSGAASELLANPPCDILIGSAAAHHARRDRSRLAKPAISNSRGIAARSRRSLTALERTP